MRRARVLLTLALVALVVFLAACSGDDEEEATTNRAPAVDAPERGGGPPGGAGQLPPEFVECMAEQGFEVESQAEIHSAPPDVLQACFGALHQGGGAP